MVLSLCFLLSLGAPEQAGWVLSALLLTAVALIYLMATVVAADLRKLRKGVYLTLLVTVPLLLGGQVVAVLTLTLFILACYLLCPRPLALALSASVLALSGVSAGLYQSLPAAYLMASVAANAALILVLNVLFRSLSSLQQQVQQSQRMDVASGALNRQALRQELEHCERLHQRYGVQTSVIQLQLEGTVLALSEADFEHLNKELVALLKSRIRKTDHLFRVERSRFVVLLAETPAANAVSLEQDLLHAVAVYEFADNHSPKLASCLYSASELAHEANWVEQVLS